MRTRLAGDASYSSVLTGLLFEREEKVYQSLVGTTWTAIGLELARKSPIFEASEF